MRAAARSIFTALILTVAMMLAAFAIASFAPEGKVEAAPAQMGYYNGAMQYCSIPPTIVNNGTPLKKICPSPYGYHFEYSSCVWWEGTGYVRDQWTVYGRVQTFTYGTVFGPYSNQVFSGWRLC